MPRFWFWCSSRRMIRSSSVRKLVVAVVAACIVVLSFVVDLRYSEVLPCGFDRSRVALERPWDPWHPHPLPRCANTCPRLDSGGLPPYLSPALAQAPIKSNSLISSESESEELQPHQYGADGLLIVNAEGPHPIFELMKRAEASWRSKLDRASKTLDEAVAEYKRRYHRAPPMGFDVWWRYVVENNVQLPDEYDQIYHDLEPFWGLDPLDLSAILTQLEVDEGVITIGKHHPTDPITVFNTTLPENRQKLLTEMVSNVLEVVEGVQYDIPPFRAVFSPYDNPSMLSEYTVKAMALEAAAARTFINVSDLPPIKTRGWIQACSPSSPARQQPIDLDAPPSPPSKKKKTFIFDHYLSMDPCLHPTLLSHHGQFLSHNQGPYPQKALVPRFSQCSTLLHHDIRPATLYNWVDDILPRSNDPPWYEKVEDRLVWRGTNTGIYHAPGTRWRDAHRARLVSWAHDSSGSASLLLLTSRSAEKEKVGRGQEISKSHINPALLDIEFAGKRVGCAPEFCSVLDGEFEWRKRQTIKDSGKYKYVLDVDGNGWSGRFKRLLTSNSLVFKSTIYPEWFIDRIEPWVHYIPVQVDLSDLYDCLVFFRGGLYGEGAHEEHAQRIANAGRTWSKRFWRKEDMTAYMFRLFLEYARVMSVDRDAMTFTEES
ncbi:glycosyltransferase family 90 protein [Serpula lacrymans var. lacrymans S7.3]|uniref:Glycosyltransferase family 90 protein n=1 Tax=Serpula lacrymans var. lacrymans (strain S7.3) TaxID=936435 RepID=F8QAQ9_SERL3|nr:glycosyltransferase family 90 protein [Serpula lacrymans var. lacrymans S7.3]